MFGIGIGEALIVLSILGLFAAAVAVPLVIVFGQRRRARPPWPPPAGRPWPPPAPRPSGPPWPPGAGRQPSPPGASTPPGGGSGGRLPR